MRPEECSKSGLRGFKMGLGASERLGEFSKSSADGPTFYYYYYYYYCYCCCYYYYYY